MPKTKKKKTPEIPVSKTSAKLKDIVNSKEVYNPPAHETNFTEFGNLKDPNELHSQLLKDNKINASTFYGQAGGSVVKVAVKGTKEVVSVEIKKDEIDVTDIDMLQDLIVVAINDAIKRVDRELEETLGSITQGIKMPGLF